MRFGSSLFVCSLVGGAVSLGGLLVGCGADDFAGCEADNNCGGSSGDAGLGGAGGTGATGGTGASGGTDGGAGVGGSSGSGGGEGGTCDTSKDPSVESCLVDDQYAVFVSPSGNDSTDGSKGTPFGTIEKAMETAKAKGLIVIACNDTFTAPVSLTSAHDGVIVHGGFDCNSGWTYDSGKKTPVAPTAAGIALSIDGVTKATGFKDFAFTAKEGTAAGESSIAAFVKNSTNVRFTRVDFSAGKGADGAKGTLTPVVHESVQANLNGKDAAGIAPGGPMPCTCPAGGSTTGGGGGGVGQEGAPGQPAVVGGTKGTGENCTSGGTGGNGKPGADQAGGAGAAAVGVLSATGFAGGVGAVGKSGTPGGGGGGGAGTSNAGSAGGGGGCGGCGGAGATGGGAGGSSIALMVFDATVDARDCTFTTLDAGKGGDGVAGQLGATQFGFGGNKSGGGCAGGNGGKGGNGGAGGGGAGGLSVGVLHNAGSTLTNNTPNFSQGKAGGKGIGGVPASNDGVPGDSKETLTL